MDIIPIFANKNPGSHKGLYACKYSGYKLDALSELLWHWSNPIHVRKMCGRAKINLLAEPYLFPNTGIAELQIRDEVSRLQSGFFRPNNVPFSDEYSAMLDISFNPLGGGEPGNWYKTRAEIAKHPLLRIYAVKWPQVFLWLQGADLKLPD